MPSLIVKGNEIKYIIKKNSRARRMSLSIYHDGNVRAVVPPGFFREKLVESFIKEKIDWILKNKAEFEKNKRSVTDERKDYLSNKKHARLIIKEKLESFNGMYNFKYDKIAIRNQRTRWGSCSSQGNLNFNYKIMLLPGYIADYIIVHELCHLKEMNHSARFWKLVAKTIPNYLAIRRELREQTLRYL